VSLGHQGASFASLTLDDRVRGQCTFSPPLCLVFGIADKSLQMVGPQVYFDSEAPYYRTGLYVDIGCWSVLVLLCIAMFFHLRRLNRRQAIRRREVGLPEDLKDISIMTIDEAAAYRAELSVVMREQGINRDIVFENAFDDMTDFE
jgi:hypothetical protein